MSWGFSSTPVIKDVPQMPFLRLDATSVARANNLFVGPWEQMPQIYANWSSSLPDLHFHYLTTLPEQVTRSYMEFIYATYPGGSFDTRPLNFSDVSANAKRLKLFWSAFTGMFLYEVIPSYMFPLLNGINVFCLASQKAPANLQNIFTNLFGGADGNEGLGFLSFSFDWQYIGSA